MSPGAEDEEVEEETTLYFDAEEGTFRGEDGSEIVFADDDATETSEEQSSQANAEEDGNRTPQASTEDRAARGAQTIQSRSICNAIPSDRQDG